MVSCETDNFQSTISSHHLKIDYTAPTPSWSYFNSDEQGEMVDEIEDEMS